LGTVLQRVLKEDADASAGDGFDLINRYLVLMCAEQLVRTVSSEAPDFWGRFPEQTADIRRQLEERRDVRGRIIAKDPGELPAFLDWFDRWFLRRAVAAEAS
jgi:hypothetical protein